jgi:UDP-glucose 4-epimerase
MAKILVTGGAGFIGSHVADRMVEAGHDVVILDNLSSGNIKNVNPKAKFYELDICDGALTDLFVAEMPDFVCHLASQIDVRKSVEEPAYDANVNILGGINLLEHCVKYKVKKLIFSSTGGAIYGEPEDLPATESCPPEPGSHYGTSKFCVEQYIKLYKRLYSLPYTILRFPNVYGPRQSPHGEAGVCSILIGLMLEGKCPALYGYGKATRDYVYVGDIARGTELALDKGEGEVINLGSAKGTTVLELFETLKAHMGFEGDPRLEDLRPGEVNKIYTSGDLAKEVLGWVPQVDLEEGLKNTLAHIQAEFDAGK